MSPKVDANIALILGLISIALVVLVLLSASNVDEDPPPFGCAWVDINPSKGADYHLACVDGYPLPSNAPD